jgi:hypothetical protein
MRYITAVDNSTRFDYTLSWHGANMLLMGVWAYLEGCGHTLVTDPSEAGYVLLQLETAETEIEALGRWHATFSGYPEESWQEQRDEVTKYLNRLRALAQRLDGDQGDTP